MLQISICFSQNISFPNIIHCSECPIAIELNKTSQSQIIDSLVLQKLDLTSNAFKTVLKVSFEYSEKNLLIKEESQYWFNQNMDYSYQNNGISHKQTNIYTYDSKNLVKEILTQTWDSIPEVKQSFDEEPHIRIYPAYMKIGKQKTFYAYDARNYMQNSFTLDLNGTNKRDGIYSDTIYNYKYTNSYNEKQKLENEITLQYIYNSWKNYTKYVYSYDSLGRILSKIEQFIGSNEGWDDYSQTNYSYNEKNCITNELLQKWTMLDEFEGSWTTESEKNNNYDLKGNLTSSIKIIQGYDSELREEYSFSYSENNKLSGYVMKNYFNSKLADTYKCIIYSK